VTLVTEVVVSPPHVTMTVYPPEDRPLNVKVADAGAIGVGAVTTTVGAGVTTPLVLLTICTLAVPGL
jgi:hypothetical protein